MSPLFFNNAKQPVRGQKSHQGQGTANAGSKVDRQSLVFAAKTMLKTRESTSDASFDKWQRSSGECLLRWLVLIDTLLNLIYATVLFIVKPALHTGATLRVTHVGIASGIAESSDENYRLFELISLLAVLNGYSFFIHMLYRYRQMLPPTNNYWLNENRFCRRMALFMFLVTVLPNIPLLRLARVDPDADKIIIYPTRFISNQESPKQPPSNAITYDGAQNPALYLYLAWSCLSLLISIIVFTKLHFYLIKALRESHKYYQECTFKQQRVVYFGFTYQMTCYFLLYAIPITFTIVFGLGNIVQCNTLYRVMLVLTSFYPILEGFSVIWFIRYYREFTQKFFGNILKPFRWVRERHGSEEREDAVMYNLGSPN
uniref:G_PROTEIN_RECEP_F1_2 domain-containing protein n=1 Tax=Panagrellus redivivus TaxID=6233 RepID=A0A7E4W8N7_PANRE